MIRSIFFFLLLIASSSSFKESFKEGDRQCLSDFKSSFYDPEGHLQSWNFSDTSGSLDFFCDNFSGVVCDLPDAVCGLPGAVCGFHLNLNLSSYSLSGSIPSVLPFCSSITSLYLSSNSLSGPIPASLCTSFPYLVNLGLSSNSLTGSIPSGLSDCKYLMSLDLSSNKLSGFIPPSLSQLRLQTLDLSGNDLSGQVPGGLSSVFAASAFQNNPSLCGYPVSSGCGITKLSIIINLVAGGFGFLLSLTISYVVWRFCFFATGGKALEERRRQSSHLRSSPSHNIIHVSLFQNPIGRLKLADLTAATAGFHPDNVIVAGSVSIGTSYKAELPNGSLLTVKRLHDSRLSDDQFQAEMGRIGQICHLNLVPLLGYCVVERLLIYGNMANGALSSRLQCGDENLDWPTRLKVAVGAARGLAWLHHGFPVPLLHQNLSSHAVLLDEDYQPKITDFGLARLSASSLPSTKGDVYDFGVILLELATGDVNNDDLAEEEGFKEKLASRVIQLCVTGRILDAVDKSLRGKGQDDQIVEFLNVACFCVLSRPEERPPMREIYRSLKRIGGGHEFSEQPDEFSRLYGRDKLESAELIKLAYCIYTGKNPWS